MGKYKNVGSIEYCIRNVLGFLPRNGSIRRNETLEDLGLNKYGHCFFVCRLNHPFLSDE